MIPLPHTHLQRAERLPYIGCAKEDILTEGLNRDPGFWDIMTPLFRVVHMLGISWKQIALPKFWEIFTR
jgi:hypothetical protein